MEKLKNIFLIVGAIALIALALFLVKSGKIKPQNPPLATPTPSLMVGEKLKADTGIFYFKNNLEKKEPYKASNFQIEYSPAATAYFVYPQGKTLEEYRTNKKEAENTFVSNSLKDLCSIRIFFVIPQEIKNQTAWEDLFASGCVPK